MCATARAEAQAATARAAAAEQQIAALRRSLEDEQRRAESNMPFVGELVSGLEVRAIYGDEDNDPAWYSAVVNEVCLYYIVLVNEVYSYYVVLYVFLYSPCDCVLLLLAGAVVVHETRPVQDCILLNCSVV